MYSLISMSYTKDFKKMACFRKASPALKEILNKLQSMENSMDVDHHLYEFGSVHYHLKASASNPNIAHLSVSMPPLSPEVMLPHGLPERTLQHIERTLSDAAEVVETPEEGYVLTLRLNFYKLPDNREDRMKVITEISSLQAIIMSSQLKDMLWNIGSEEMSYGMYKPIKLVYHPREPFFIIRMPEKLTAIFPMRFKDYSDVILATEFFQELVDVGNSSVYAKAPRCTWSPIPPPDLRGENFQYLTTNGGFVSFDILSHHVKGERAYKVIWILLNFDAYIKYHVKCTRGFIQRKMRQRMAWLAEVIQNARIGREVDADIIQSCRYVASCEGVKKLMRISKSVSLRRNCGAFASQIKRMRSRIKIKGLHRFRGHWFRIPKFTSFGKYTKLD